MGLGFLVAMGILSHHRINMAEDVLVGFPLTLLIGFLKLLRELFPQRAEDLRTTLQVFKRACKLGHLLLQGYGWRQKPDGSRTRA